MFVALIEASKDSPELKTQLEVSIEKQRVLKKDAEIEKIIAERERNLEIQRKWKEKQEALAEANRRKKIFIWSGSPADYETVGGIIFANSLEEAKSIMKRNCIDIPAYRAERYGVYELDMTPEFQQIYQFW
jgi:hypothetical protein